MKYKESLIPKTAKELCSYISNVMLSAPKRRFLEFEDFDGAFFTLERGANNLTCHLGEEKSKQVAEMLLQAKRHYEAGDNKLGGALMEDAKMFLLNRQPWAYPKELYRWGIEPSLPEASEADYLSMRDLE